jgi:hypothetical protein
VLVAPAIGRCARPVRTTGEVDVASVVYRLAWFAAISHPRPKRDVNGGSMKIARRLTRTGTAFVLTAAALASSSLAASPAQAVSKDCSDSIRIGLTRQSGTNPHYPDVRVTACIYASEPYGVATLTVGGDVAYLKVYWRIEAHGCRGGGIAKRGYIQEEWRAGDPEAFEIQAPFTSDDSRKYKANGRVESIYVQDRYGNVFTGGGVGAGSSCS